MRLFLLFFLLVAPVVANAQISGEDEVYLNGDYVEARFNGGGIEKFHEFIYSRLDRSKITKPGKIVFTFVISETGEIKDVRIVEFPYVEMATEIIRVIKTAPKWQPAKRGGKPTSLNVRFPMEFVQKGNKEQGRKVEPTEKEIDSGRKE
ncbi:energy transducer TonB [Flavobacterium humi]|uniref:TonB C-terminal domain-containing protein n=1 Tax=Flavobacterium humi TaxID=2562683 RepID=A0A4Z0L4P1_9FLAO|nr:energy transducer TonB [Flavobacterium humi]TGD57427.1 hypothetical protein E4635_12475 [Flavobacterium humi]